MGGEGVVVELLLGEALGDGFVGTLRVGMLGARELEAVLVGIWLLFDGVAVEAMVISTVEMCWFMDSWPPYRGEAITLAGKATKER